MNETGLGLAGRRKQRWTAADHAFDVLEQAVIAGVLKPGHRLTELSLAAELELSRTPLRQAIQRLVSKGWIERFPNGAIYVVDVSEQEIQALYEVRIALEVMMFRNAAERMQPSDLDHLQSLVESQEQAAKARKPDLLSDYGEEFHRAIWELSGNLVGIQILEEVRQRTTRYRRLSFSHPYRFRKGLMQHKQLVLALQKDKIDQACRLLRAHVEESRDYALDAFRKWHGAGRN